MPAGLCLRKYRPASYANLAVRMGGIPDRLGQKRLQLEQGSMDRRLPER